MGTQTLAGALLLLAVSCSSNPPAELAGRDQAPPTPTIVAVVQEAPALTSGPVLDQPFALAATYSGAQVNVMGDTIGLSVLHARADDAMPLITAFRLKDGQFVKVGSTVLPFSVYPGDLEEGGDSVYVSVVTPVDRSAIRQLVPIPGPGQPIDQGDVHNAQWSLMGIARTPDCGEPADDGKQAMKRVQDAFDLDRQHLLLGEACDGTWSLQIIDTVARSSRSLPFDKAASVFQSNFGVVLLGDDVSVWNGSTFSSVAPRPPAGTTSIMKGPGGVYFASTSDPKSFDTSLENHVLRGQSWRLLALPDGRTQFELRLGKTTLWAFAGNHLTQEQIYKYLAPDERPPRVAAIDGETAVAGAPVEALAAPASLFKPAGPKCDTNVVVLYGFSKVTPDDYDFPLTRKAIKGHTELGGVRFAVTEERGKKYFVGRSASFAQAQKLAKVIEAGVKGSKPQIVCSEPKVVRELSIDLATGNVKK